MKTEIILFGIALIVHELGHYIGYKLFKKNPNIKFKWFGIVIGENVWHTLKPFEAYIISMMGVLIGGIVMFGTNFFTLYLLACCIDITNIISLLSLEKKYHKLTLLEIGKIQLKELESK